MSIKGRNSLISDCVARTDVKEAETPWWMRDNYGPVSEETEVLDLAVDGEIPQELHGMLTQIGPNPLGNSPHWFLGHGMVHGILLRSKQAVRYRSRWIRTPYLDDPRRGLDRPENSPANTNIVVHGGRILVLEERHLPYEINSDLETIGPVDFDGALKSALTAHPKICPESGELLAFSHDTDESAITYHRFDTAGNCVFSQVVEFPKPVMIHDFAMTSDHVIFLDLPVVFEPQSAGSLPYRWDDGHTARIGLMNRHGGAVQWFEIEPCYVFHTINACSIGNRVTLDACRYPSLWEGGVDNFTSPAMVHRWTLNTAAGEVREETLFDVRCDFPSIDNRMLGKPNRYAYVSTMVDEERGSIQHGHRVVKLDFVTGTTEHHHFGVSRYVCASAYVPRCAEAQDEDDGYVLAIVYERTRDTSELVILDAKSLADEPLATVALPVRVPFGFHSSWIPAEH